MAKVEVQSLAKHLKSIEKGSYWFGMIGRITILWGVASLALFALVLTTHGWPISMVKKTSFGMELSPIFNLFFGWMFLLGRDAFNAIAALIKEMDGVV